MDASGRITATRTLSHEETAGLGAKVAEDPFQSQFAGLDRAALDQADAISGATVSTKGITMGANAALAAVEALG